MGWTWDTRFDLIHGVGPGQILDGLALDRSGVATGHLD